MREARKRQKTHHPSACRYLGFLLLIRLQPPVKNGKLESLCVALKRQPVTWSGNEVTDHWV